MSGVGPEITPEQREAARERRKEERRRQQDEQTARSLAQASATPAEGVESGYWEMLGDADLDHPDWDDNLEAFISGETSRAHALGNITRKDWKDKQLRIENEFFQLRNEMRGPDTTISDSDMRMLHGGERTKLSDSRARRLRAAREVKRQQSSLSVNARGLRSGTEIHAVAKTENVDETGEDSSLFRNIGSYLQG
jgi:hypothetical protein